GAEEEQLRTVAVPAVPSDRAAEIPSVVLEVEGVLLIGEEILRVEPIVADEAVAAALELPLAASRDAVDLRAAGLAVLGRVLAGEDLELFDRVNRDVVHLRRVRARIEVLAAVERDRAEVLAQPVDLLAVGPEARAELVAAVVARHARHDVHQPH